MLIEHSPCTRQGAKHLTYVLSLNPHHNYEISTIIISFTNEKPEGSWRVHDLPEVTQLEREGARI